MTKNKSGGLSPTLSMLPWIISGIQIYIINMRIKKYVFIHKTFSMPRRI